MTVVTCHGITKGGTRCRARPLVGSNYCLAHSPTISDEQRAAWRATGGANSASKVRARKALPTELMHSDELAAWLTVCLKQVIAGRMDPPVGTAAANLARTIAEIRRGAEIEGRLSEVETMLGSIVARRPA